MFTLFITAVNYFLIIISFLIIASAILSWFPVPALNKIKHLLNNLTEPILAPIRKMIQKSIFGGSHMLSTKFRIDHRLIVTTIQRYLTLFFLKG